MKARQNDPCHGKVGVEKVYLMPNNYMVNASIARPFIGRAKPLCRGIA
jgi:hypothetical protein